MSDIKELIASKLRPVANAIRTKKHTSDLIPIDNYEEEILSIEPIYDTITLTKNGEHDVKDYKSAVVSVAGDELIKLIDGTIEGPLDLSNVTIRDGMNFLRCKNLKGVVLPNNMTYLPENFFKECFSCGDLIIPEGISNIGKAALDDYAKSLPQPAKVYFPATLTYLGLQWTPNIDVYYNGTIEQYLAMKHSDYSLASYSKNGFYIKTNEGGYEKLEIVEVPEGVTFIQYGFAKSKCFKGFKFPNSLTSFLNNAFLQMDGIAVFNIPATITSIGSKACQFKPTIANAGTDKITIIMEGETPASLSSNAFDTSCLNKIFVPIGSRTNYIAATNWSSYADYIVEPNTIILSIPETLLNNENYTYSIDNKDNYQQFTDSVISLENISTLKFKNLDANTTILIGTTEGGSDVGTIANAELLYPTSGDATIYLTIQA